MTGPDSGGESAPFPERVGRYELLLPIASGGMAKVYLARTTGLGGFEKEIALKLTHAHLREDSGFATSLMDEANLAGRIRHPNVVSVLDVGEGPHGVYLVMEYVEGETLAGLVRLADEAGSRIPDRIALRVIDDALAGLHAAHELAGQNGELLGLVHRDVTPHNVLVGVDGIAKLADFGVAKAATRLGVTATGLIKGKVAYMSPEQALGHPLDRTCDVWAAGVILWELLTGMRLHTTTSDAATLLRIVSRIPPRLRTLRPDVAPQLDEVIARALDMDRTRRFATAEDLAHALEAATAGGGGRAERREVKAYVESVVAERLERRRRRVNEVLELRGRLSQVTHAALPSQPGTPSSTSAVSQPGMDPTVVDVPLPLDEHDETVTQPQRVSQPPDSSTDSTRLDSQPHHQVVTAHTASVGGIEAAPEPTHTETISVSAALAGSDVSKRGRLKWVAAATGIGAMGVVALVAQTATDDAEQNDAASGAPDGFEMDRTGAAEPAPLTPESLAIEPATPDDLPLADRPITLSATTPIKTVYVGSRRVTFEREKNEQTLNVSAEERAADLTVVARDGRRARVRLAPDAGRFEVVFGAPSAPPATRRAPSAGDPKRGSGDGLLTNPYGSQK